VYKWALYSSLFLCQIIESERTDFYKFVWTEIYLIFGVTLLCWYLFSEVKVKLSLCLTEHHAMKMYPLLTLATCHEDAVGEWRYCSTHIRKLNTILRWVVSFRPRPLYPRGSTPSTRCVGGWVGPRSRCWRSVEEKNSLPLPGIGPQSST